MEDCPSRSRARTVAYANLILLILSLFMSIIIKDTTVDKNSFNNQVLNGQQGKDEDVLTMVALFVFTMAILLLLLGFCAAVKLLRATDKGREPNEALSMAMFWQIVNLMYILLGTLELVMFRSFWHVFALLLLLGTSLLFWRIVYQFMNELKQAAANMKAQIEEKQTPVDSMI